MTTFHKNSLLTGAAGGGRGVCGPRSEWELGSMLRSVEASVTVLWVPAETSNHQSRGNDRSLE